MMKNLPQLLVIGLLLALWGCNSLDPMEPDGPLASLDDLQGEWVRTGSNNPSADGIEVRVAGAQGTITDPAATSFSVGEVKWQDLTPATETAFDYQELGSDGSYYDATLTIVDDSTLSIQVAATGAGNTQTWIAKGTHGADIDPFVIPNGYFSEDRTLENTPAAIDYIIDRVANVTARLIIEPGVVIAFEANAGLGIYDNGSITAAGTATEPITFKGSTATQGWWRGVHLETNNPLNELSHMIIEHAGSNYVYCCNDAASLFIKDGQVKLQDLTLRQGGDFGLVVREAAQLNDYARVTITSHEGQPGKIAPERLGELDGIDSDYTGNDEDLFYVETQAINEEVTWKAINVPYLLEGKVLNIEEGLVVEAGVEIVMEQGAGLGVYGNGYLAINGSSTAPVVMKGEQATKGWWRGINIETNNNLNSIDYLQLSDAGSNYVYCCNEVSSIFFEAGQASLTNSTVSNGKGYGVVANEAFEFSDYENNTITSHDELPLYVQFNRLGELDGLGSDYTGNDKDFIGVFNTGAEDEPITIDKTNVPYRFDAGDVFDLVEAVTIEAGSELVFQTNAGLGVYDEGSFTVNGTATEPVIFRSESGQPGTWRGIHIETNDINNRISYATIEDGGSNYVYCCNTKANVLLKGGQLTVENSTLRDSGGCGIAVQSNGNLTETGNTFTNNTDGDVCN